MLTIIIVTIVAANSIEFSDAASALFLSKIRPLSAGLEDGGGVLHELTSLEESASSKLSQIETGLLQVGQAPGKPMSVKQVYAQMFSTWAVWVVLAVAVYFICYRSLSPLPEMKATEEKPDDIQIRLQKLLTTGHWQCMEDSNICLFSFFCPSLRWADTTSQATPLSFWAAFATLCGVSLVNVASTGAIFGLFTALLILYFRHQLRDKEARIVKEAIESGYELFTSPTVEAAPEA